MPQAKQALLALRNDHSNDDYIFWGEHPHAPLGVAGFESLIKKAFIKVGLPADKAHPHALRHSCSGAYDSLSVTTIQKIYGHSSI
jgi:site-specific recombinase XerD